MNGLWKDIKEKSKCWKIHNLNFFLFRRVPRWAQLTGEEATTPVAYFNLRNGGQVKSNRPAGPLPGRSPSQKAGGQWLRREAMAWGRGGIMEGIKIGVIDPIWKMNTSDRGSPSSWVVANSKLLQNMRWWFLWIFGSKAHTNESFDKKRKCIFRNMKVFRTNIDFLFSNEETSPHRKTLIRPFSYFAAYKTDPHVFTKKMLLSFSRCGANMISGLWCPTNSFLHFSWLLQKRHVKRGPLYNNWESIICCA